MTCSNCGSDAVDITGTTGGIDTGEFTEEYECESCGATGEITGDAADPPGDWERTGEVFNA